MSASAQAPVRVASAYEDTVRVVVLWNTPRGHCAPPYVGKETFDFVIQALDTSQVPNVVVMPTAVFADSTSTDPNYGAIDYAATLNEVQDAFGTGRPPHAVVHINAGWGTHNGPNIEGILNWAVENYVGVVEIGDDAAWLAQSVFGISLVDNLPQPMGDATWLRDADDEVWITLAPDRDTLANPAEYPFLNGIVTNSANMVDPDRLDFEPWGSPSGSNSRCQADPDAYTILPGEANKVTFLAYQQASDGGILIGGVDQFNTIAAFQDSILTSTGLVARRAVSLAFQPQYLVGTSLAAEQVVYDAIMFASLAHTLRPPSEIFLNINDTTLAAGDTIPVRAYLIADNGDTIVVDSVYDNVTWQQITVPQTGDVLLSSSGQTTSFTATMAHRTVTLRATYDDPTFGTRLTAEAILTVVPGPAYRIVLETDPVADLYSPRDLELVRIADQVNESDTLYAFLRDRLNNLLGANNGRATNALWQINPDSTPSFAQVDVAPGGSTEKATVLRVNDGFGDTRVIASHTGGLVSDTAKVEIRSTPSAAASQTHQIWHFDFTGASIDRSSGNLTLRFIAPTANLSGIRFDLFDVGGKRVWRYADAGMQRPGPSIAAVDMGECCTEGIHLLRASCPSTGEYRWVKLAW